MEEQIIQKFIKEFPIPCSYHSIITSKNGAVFDFEYLYVNNHFEKLFDIKSTEIVTTKFSNLLLLKKETREQWIKYSKAVIDQNITLSDFCYDVIKGKDIKINIIPLDKQHFFITYEGINVNEERHNNSDDFFDANIELMCIVDMSGKFIKVNDKFEYILGYTKAEFNEKHMRDFVHKDDWEKNQKALLAIKRKNTLSGFTNRYHHKNGRYLTIEWKVRLQGDYLYCAGRDITEARMIHKELANKTKQLEEANNKLENIANKDQLTGLYNRMYFDNKISDVMNKAEQLNVPLSMLIFDLDYFKNINDKYGHPVGDEVLRLLSFEFKKNTRKDEFACRIGGEEFALIMPDTSLNDAEQVAERIRKAFENINHLIVGKVTASFGVAEKKYGESFLEWYRRIDKALYIAKDQGRNQVVLDYTNNIAQL